MKCQQQFCTLEARFSGSSSKPHLGAARAPPGVGPRGVGEAGRDVAVAAGVARVVAREAPVGDTTADRQNFGKRLLVFGCIGADLCK